MLNLFMQHTSAALTLNENWDPDVRADMTDALSRAVPEGSMYRHSDEGPDDMPGHVKAPVSILVYFFICQSNLTRFLSGRCKFEYSNLKRKTCLGNMARCLAL